MLDLNKAVKATIMTYSGFIITVFINLLVLINPSIIKSNTIFIVLLFSGMVLWFAGLIWSRKIEVEEFEKHKTPISLKSNSEMGNKSHIAEKENQLSNKNTQSVKTISKPSISNTNNYNNINDNRIPTASSTVNKELKPLEVINNNAQISSISVIFFIEQMIKFKKLYDNEMLSFTEYTQMKAGLFEELEKYGVKESKSDFLLELSPLVSNNMINDEDLQKIKNILFKSN